MNSLDQLLDYVRAQRAHSEVFRGVPDQWLADYLAFHRAQGTLVVAEGRSQKSEVGGPTFDPCPLTSAPLISGLGIGWQCHAREILDAPDYAFRWQPTNPAGDAFFVAQLVADDAESLRSILLHYLTVFAPAPYVATGRTLRLFGQRRAGLVEYPASALRRLYQSTSKEIYE